MTVKRFAQKVSKKLAKKSAGKYWGSCGMAIAILLSITPGAIAAETIRLKLGPLSQSITVTELEDFANTGNLPKHLKFYESFIDPKIQGFLQKKVQIQPEVATQVLDQLWRSPAGQTILQQVSNAMPGSSVEDIKTALDFVASQELEINALSVLRAYPADELTIDVSALASLLLQINLPNLQSQILSPRITAALEQNITKAVIPTNLDPTLAGNQMVRRQTVVLQDYERNRTIPVDIYDSPKIHDQLVVLSHGFGANRRFLDYLAYHLASHGYVVVSPEHPGSNVQSLLDRELSFESLLPASEFVDRPKDISFVLDELAALNEQAAFKNRFSTDNVTVIGHSFGGYTALSLAGGTIEPPAIRDHCNSSRNGANPLLRAPGDWLQCAAATLPDDQLNLRDERIKQAIALNPVIGEIFGTEGLADISIPTLVLAATKDAITPSLTHQLLPFKALGGEQFTEKYLVVASGATHMSGTDLSNRDSLLSRSTLVPEIMGAEAEPVRQMLKALSLSFLERREANGEVYNRFFSTDYVQSLSSDKIQLRFTQTIPTELEKFLGQLPQSQIQAYRKQVGQRQTPMAIASLLQPVARPAMPTYPSGELSVSFAPFFDPAAEDQLVEPYYVANLGEMNWVSSRH